MKLHILETFTAGHILDPEVKEGDFAYFEVGIGHRPFKDSDLHWAQAAENQSDGVYWRVYLAGPTFQTWLTENNIPQNPNEWDEEQMFRFQLRFG